MDTVGAATVPTIVAVNHQTTSLTNAINVNQSNGSHHSHTLTHNAGSNGSTSSNSNNNSGISNGSLISSKSSSSSGSSSSSSSASSNSSGYGSTSATPTNSYETHTAATTPIATAEPIIPIATVAAVSPFFSESITTQSLVGNHYEHQPQQQQQQQQHLNHQQHQTHLQIHQQPQSQPQHQQFQQNLRHTQSHQYYSTTYDYQQQPQQQQPPQQQTTHLHQQQQQLRPTLNLSSTYNMGSSSPAFDGASSITPPTGVAYQQPVSQYKTASVTSINCERNLAPRSVSSATIGGNVDIAATPTGPTLSYQQPLQSQAANESSTTAPTHSQTHQQQQHFLAASNSTKSRSSSSLLSSSSATTTKPQAAATPFYAQPLIQQSNNSSSFYDNLKHKMPLDYHDNFANIPNAAAYHQQQKYYAAAKSQLKEASTYGSSAALTGKSLYPNSTNYYTGPATQHGTTGYDKYMYPTVYPSLGYETPLDPAYRKSNAAGSLNSPSWPWGIEYASANSRTIPPPTGHIPTATVAPTHASYLTANTSHLARDPYYMTHDKYGMKYDKYAPQYQQTYASPPSTRHHLWPGTHTAISERLPPPPHAVHSSPYYPANTPAALNARQSFCPQPYPAQNCYYPPTRLPPHGQTTTMGQNSAYMATAQSAAHPHQPHLSPLSSTCKYGGVMDYATANKLKHSNDLYLGSHYDTNPQSHHLAPNHGYSYGSAAAAANQLYNPNQVHHGAQPAGPLITHEPLANAPNFANDLGLNSNSFENYIHDPAHMNPQGLGLHSGLSAVGYGSASAKRALLEYRKPIQPQQPPTPTQGESFGQAQPAESITRNTSREHYQSTEVLNTPEPTTTFNEYDTQSQASTYAADEGATLLQQSVKPSNEATKNLSLRDFIANWNDDEDDYVANDNMAFDQSTVINEVLQATTASDAEPSMHTAETPILEANKVSVPENVSKAVEQFNEAPLADVDTNQYVNLPDIIIDIEKSNINVNSSITMPHNTVDVEASLSLDNFDVEKELDQLQMRRIGNDSLPSKLNYDITKQTKDSRNGINPNVEHQKSKDNDHSRGPTSQISFDDLNLEQPKAVLSTRSGTTDNLSGAQPEQLLKDMEGYDSSSSRHSNESSLFEKEYETFINKITAVNPKACSENVINSDFEQNVKDFSKFYKRKRKLKDGEKKIAINTNDDVKKLKCSEEEDVNNSNFPQVYTKKSRNRRLPVMKRLKANETRKRKPMSAYYKLIHSLRRYRLYRSKRVRDYIAELKEKHLPLIKRRSIKNYSVATNRLFHPESLKSLVLTIINSEEFRKRIMPCVEEPMESEEKHVCLDPACETCEIIRSLMEPEPFEDSIVQQIRVESQGKVISATSIPEEKFNDVILESNGEVISVANLFLSQLESIKENIVDSAPKLDKLSVPECREDDSFEIMSLITGQEDEGKQSNQQETSDLTNPYTGEENKQELIITRESVVDNVGTQHYVDCDDGNQEHGTILQITPELTSVIMNAAQLQTRGQSSAIIIKVVNNINQPEYVLDKPKCGVQEIPNSSELNSELHADTNSQHQDFPKKLEEECVELTNESFINSEIDQESENLNGFNEFEMPEAKSLENLKSPVDKELKSNSATPKTIPDSDSDTDSSETVSDCTSSSSSDSDSSDVEDKEHDKSRTSGDSESEEDLGQKSSHRMETRKRKTSMEKVDSCEKVLILSASDGNQISSKEAEPAPNISTTEANTNEEVRSPMSVTRESDYICNVEPVTTDPTENSIPPGGLQYLRNINEEAENEENVLKTNETDSGSDSSGSDNDSGDDNDSSHSEELEELQNISQIPKNKQGEYAEKEAISVKSITAQNDSADMTTNVRETNIKNETREKEDSAMLEDSVTAAILYESAATEAEKGEVNDNAPDYTQSSKSPYNKLKIKDHNLRISKSVDGFPNDSEGKQTSHKPLSHVYEIVRKPFHTSTYEDLKCSPLSQSNSQTNLQNTPPCEQSKIFQTATEGEDQIQNLSPEHLNIETPRKSYTNSSKVINVSDDSSSSAGSEDDEILAEPVRPRIILSIRRTTEVVDVTEDSTSEEESDFDDVSEHPNDSAIIKDLGRNNKFDEETRTSDETEYEVSEIEEEEEENAEEGSIQTPRTELTYPAVPPERNMQIDINAASKVESSSLNFFDEISGPSTDFTQVNIESKEYIGKGKSLQESSPKIATPVKEISEESRSSIESDCKNLSGEERTNSPIVEEHNTSQVMNIENTTLPKLMSDLETPSKEGTFSSISREEDKNEDTPEKAITSDTTVTEFLANSKPSVEIVVESVSASQNVNQEGISVPNFTANEEKEESSLTALQIISRDGELEIKDHESRDLANDLESPIIVQNCPREALSTVVLDQKPNHPDEEQDNDGTEHPDDCISDIQLDSESNDQEWYKLGSEIIETSSFIDEGEEKTSSEMRYIDSTKDNNDKQNAGESIECVKNLDKNQAVGDAKLVEIETASEDQFVQIMNTYGKSKHSLTSNDVPIEAEISKTIQREDETWQVPISNKVSVISFSKSLASSEMLGVKLNEKFPKEPITITGSSYPNIDESKISDDNALKDTCKPYPKAAAEILKKDCCAEYVVNQADLEIPLKNENLFGETVCPIALKASEKSEEVEEAPYLEFPQISPPTTLGVGIQNIKEVSLDCVDADEADEDVRLSENAKSTAIESINKTSAFVAGSEIATQYELQVQEKYHPSDVEKSESEMKPKPEICDQMLRVDCLTNSPNLSSPIAMPSFTEGKTSNVCEIKNLEPAEELSIQNSDSHRQPSSLNRSDNRVEPMEELVAEDLVVKRFDSIPSTKKSQISTEVEKDKSLENLSAETLKSEKIVTFSLSEIKEGGPLEETQASNTAIDSKTVTFESIENVPEEAIISEHSFGISSSKTLHIRECKKEELLEDTSSSKLSSCYLKTKSSIPAYLAAKDIAIQLHENLFKESETPAKSLAVTSTHVLEGKKIELLGKQKISSSEQFLNDSPPDISLTLKDKEIELLNEITSFEQSPINLSHVNSKSIILRDRLTSSHPDITTDEATFEKHNLPKECTQSEYSLTVTVPQISPSFKDEVKLTDYQPLIDINPQISHSLRDKDIALLDTLSDDDLSFEKTVSPLCQLKSKPTLTKDSSTALHQEVVEREMSLETDQNVTKKTIPQQYLSISSPQISRKLKGCGDKFLAELPNETSSCELFSKRRLKSEVIITKSSVAALNHDIYISDENVFNETFVLKHPLIVSSLEISHTLKDNSIEQVDELHRDTLNSGPPKTALCYLKSESAIPGPTVREIPSESHETFPTEHSLTDETRHISDSSENEDKELKVEVEIRNKTSGSEHTSCGLWSLKSISGVTNDIVSTVNPDVAKKEIVSKSNENLAKENFNTERSPIASSLEISHVAEDKEDKFLYKLSKESYLTNDSCSLKTESAFTKNTVTVLNSDIAGVDVRFESHGQPLVVYSPQISHTLEDKENKLLAVLPQENSEQSSADVCPSNSDTMNDNGSEHGSSFQESSNEKSEDSHNSVQGSLNDAPVYPRFGRFKNYRYRNLEKSGENKSDDKFAASEFSEPSSPKAEKQENLQIEKPYANDEELTCSFSENDILNMAQNRKEYSEERNSNTRCKDDQVSQTNLESKTDINVSLSVSSMQLQSAECCRAATSEFDVKNSIMIECISQPSIDHSESNSMQIEPVQDSLQYKTSSPLDISKISSATSEDITNNTTMDKSISDMSTDFFGFKNQSSVDDESGDFHGFEDQHEEERIRREIENLNDDSAANDAFSYMTLEPKIASHSNSMSSELNELEALEKELSQNPLLKDLDSQDEEEEGEAETDAHLVSVSNVTISTNDIEHIKKMLESDEEHADNEELKNNSAKSDNEKAKSVVEDKENISLSNVCIAPKLSDLCRAALNSSLNNDNDLIIVQSSSNTSSLAPTNTTNTNNTTTSNPLVIERELSVEEALAEMYRQAGVLLSDPEDVDNEKSLTSEEAHDVLLINLQEILNSDNDNVYVLQCDMSVNVGDTNSKNRLADDDSNGDRNANNNLSERVNTLQVIGILNSNNENPEIHIISSDSESEVIILSDCDTDVEFQPPPPTPKPRREYIPFINDLDDDSQSDLSTIHHEEIVPDNLNKFLQEEFYKYLREKYAQRKLSKYYHANRVLRKYKRRSENKVRL